MFYKFFIEFLYEEEYFFYIFIGMEIEMDKLVVVWKSYYLLNYVYRLGLLYILFNLIFNLYYRIYYYFLEEER